MAPFSQGLEPPQNPGRFNQYFPTAERIRLVVDNLNTHTPAALYGVFAPAEARRITRKLEFHYTPKHGSWLIHGRPCLPQASIDDGEKRKIAAIHPDFE